ncbi:MAG: queuosine precursor transporter [Myxococcaceae bacterium]|nr:queuosine precursor transporter [Myxococcaceae bacterium]MBH2006456.1 queuosine precursor transporter [Myxococcaceae bacterium]
MNEFVLLLQVAWVVGASIWAAGIGREALLVLISLQAIMANLLVLKQVYLFGLHVTCSDAFAIGSIFSLNLLQERFGLEESKRATWLCFGSMLFFALSTQIHLLYMPSKLDHMHPHYYALLMPAPRLFLASLTSFFVVQQLDIRFYQFLRQRWGHWRWGVRSTLSLLVSQLLDTCLFTLLGLYGSVDSLPQILLFSYLTKVLMIGVIGIVSR